MLSSNLFLEKKLKVDLERFELSTHSGDVTPIPEFFPQTPLFLKPKKSSVSARQIPIRQGNVISCSYLEFLRILLLWYKFVYWIFDD